jgi:flagellin-like hook-associated protein FlgL
MSRITTGTRSNTQLLQVQQQLASGLRVNRFSDDAAAASIISILDGRLDRSQQVQRNLDHAGASLDTLDSALGEAFTLATDARDMASDQVNSIYGANERKLQASVVESMIQTLFRLANTQSPAGSIFGGSTPGKNAVDPLFGGYRFAGSGPGLVTDIGLFGSVPITLGVGAGAGGGGNAIGSTSSRIRGTVDLDPTITTDTRLADTAGARGIGITTHDGAAIEFAVNTGNRVRVDLSGLDTVGDVIDRLTASFRAYETQTGQTILTGIGVSGERLTIDAAPGMDIRFFDAASGVIGQDLGLVSQSTVPLVFNAGNNQGLELAPRLTWKTPVSELAGVTGPLGSIRLSNIGQTRVIDLSQAQTLEDIKNALEGAGVGVRVEINAAGNGIDVLNETAAGAKQALSISEVPGSNQTATRLGIRSLGPQTLTTDLNDGRGVSIAHNNIDPLTSLPNPTLDIDLTITLGDLAGTKFNVDLRPQDMATMQTVIDRINQQAVAAGLSVPGQVEAFLHPTENGLALRQATTFALPIKVEGQNNSQAAEQLGLLKGTYDPSTATLLGEDRATVRVDNLFTSLIDLRDSLLNNNVAGITLAGERLEGSISNLTEARGLVGGFARRVENANAREKDVELLDQSTKSDLQDLDFAEAATRLSMLQVQLQATMRTTAIVNSSTLLDFLAP